MVRYKVYYVAFPDNDGPGGRTCGHQHDTQPKAVNCGGNAYRVTRKRDSDDPEAVFVSMTRVSS